MACFTFQPPAGLAGRRLMVWLRDRLAVRGVAAMGPMAGAGAGLRVNGEDGFVSLRLAGEDEGRQASVIVERIGEAEAEYEDTVFACQDVLTARRTWDLSA